MDAFPMDETIDIDDERFILLSFDRMWPKYVVSWSVRERAGESDFPLAGGSAEALPPRDDSLDNLWNRLREEAKAAADAAVDALSPSAPKKPASLLARLFGKR